MRKFLLARPRYYRGITLVAMEIHKIVLVVLLLCIHLSLTSSHCTEPIVSYVAWEEHYINAFVGDVKANLTQRYPNEILDSFQYAIAQGPYKQYFTLHKKKGILQTSAKATDRELLCPSDPVCTLLLDIVVVKPITHVRVFTVAVVILDVNDSPPVFPQSQIVFNISSTDVPGLMLAIPPAVDLDTGSRGVVEYELISDSSKFELQVPKNTDNITDLHLVLKVRLDREEESEYKLKVLGKDGVNVPGEIEIVINVIGLTNINPVFEQKVVNITVPEDFPLMSPFAQVHAESPFAGPGSAITYSLSEWSEERYGHMIAVDGSSGEVVLLSALDYEEDQVIQIFVIATNQNADADKAQATVRIHVTDVNDNRPTVSVQTFTSHGGVQILEGSHIGTFVAHVTVNDRDSGDFGQVECHLLENERHFVLLKLHDTEYKIVSAAELDRELIEIHIADCMPRWRTRRLTPDHKGHHCGYCGSK